MRSAAFSTGLKLVVHLAARAGGIAFQRSADPAVFTVNRRITDNVLGAASAAGVKRVFLASSLVTYRVGRNAHGGPPQAECGGSTESLHVVEDHR